LVSFVLLWLLLPLLLVLLVVVLALVMVLLLRLLLAHQLPDPLTFFTDLLHHPVLKRPSTSSGDCVAVTPHVGVRGAAA